jgi:hypothetical protein
MQGDVCDNRKLESGSENHYTVHPTPTYGEGVHKTGHRSASCYLRPARGLFVYSLLAGRTQPGCECIHGYQQVWNERLCTFSLS